MNKFIILSASASLLCVSVGSVAKTTAIAKHLAGPAEEIELMQKADPAASAIISKHAMIPVTFEKQATGEFRWQKDILIDGANPKLLLFGADKSNWKMAIGNGVSGKNGTEQSIEYLASETNFGMGSQKFPATKYELSNLNSGRYDFSVSADSAQSGYLLVSSDSPYRLKSYVSSTGQLVGDVINVNAMAFTDDNKFTVVNSDLQLINSSYMSVTSPDGTAFERSMFDDGASFDKSADDGEFNGQFIADQAGLYRVQIVTQGITPMGKPFLRTAEHIIPIVASDVVMKSKAAFGEYVDTNKINLSFSLNTTKKQSRFRVVAEVWGTTTGAKSSELIPVTWLSTIAEVKNGAVNLQLDDRWVIAKNVNAPFELRNIRVEEIDHYISLLEVDSLSLKLPAISQFSKSNYDGGINESMMKGNKPKSLNSNHKAGGKLMLVHGYCSGDAWGPVQSQFSNSVKFTDFNQNRSHDAFARLIDGYGDNFPSFGVVAHSQGGAASLHLYTYYWSGLDDADPGRLIQSVGTPYQGTPLAGNLALIGDIFGIGCGYNSNLTTSGASAWLSGIPTWARSKVNYYTTSFTDKWWRPDWCNFASDFVLSDPEDGTTEKSRGQLSGAVNRGHRTGQCHTEGMRDMAQTRDSGRNSTMSSNAAR